jgi:hypothetical protein
MEIHEPQADKWRILENQDNIINSPETVQMSHKPCSQRRIKETRSLVRSVTEEQKR